VVWHAPGWRCPFIGARGGCRAMIMAGIGGETGGSMHGDLSALKLQFKRGGGNGCGLVLKGGGSCTGGGGGHGGSGAAAVQARRW
jgi:hypothetical protein